MQLDVFIEKLNQSPQSLVFEETMAVIEANYHFTPSAFINGEVENSDNENQGSCKLLAFAKLNGLNQAQTLACFGQYYRDVAATPDGSDHQNIRNFMRFGWDKVSFDGEPLSQG